MILLHILERTAWEAARETGVYMPPSLTTDGFIHFSKPEQIPFVAHHYFREQAGLVLLVVDSDTLTAPVQWEAVPEHGTFPHLYGPLPVDSVITVLPFDPSNPEIPFLGSEDTAGA